MMTMKKNRKITKRELLESCNNLKDQLIHLLKDKIKKFQDVTWESQPTTGYFFCYGDYHTEDLCIYNGAAVQWRIDRNRRDDLPDGYGQIMWIAHDSPAWRHACDPAVDLDELSHLEVARLAVEVCKTIRETLKHEAAYLLKTYNKLMKVIEEAENLSLEKLLEGVPGEVEVGG
jgi:hypothetical protein